MQIQLNKKGTAASILPIRKDGTSRFTRLTLPRMLGMASLAMGLFSGEKAVATTKSDHTGEKSSLQALSGPSFISTQHFNGNVTFEPRNSIQITWLPNPPSENVIEYRVYSSGPAQLRISNVVNTGLSTTGKLENLDLHMVSTHRITASNAAGLESDPSDPCIFWQGIATSATRYTTAAGTQIALQFERLATVPYAAGFLYRTNPAHAWQHAPSVSMSTTPLQNGLVQEMFAISFFDKTFPDAAPIYLRQGVIGASASTDNPTPGKNFRVISVD